MAIGTAAAIGLGVAGIRSALGGMSSNKAAGKAADAQAQAAAQQTALQREMYNKNVNLLSPYIQAGVPATQNINALLGIGMGAPVASGGSSTSTPGGGADWGQYLHSNPDVLQGYYATADKNRFATPEDYAQWHYGTFGANEGRAFPSIASVATQGAAPGAPQGTTQQQAEQAFDTFRNSSGYKFGMDEALSAVRGGFSGNGALKSGAALNALATEAQGRADQSIYNYMGMLGNQQSVGMGAASAAAGVGQNTANSLTSIAQNAADARSNAALSKTNPLANSLSLIGGGIFGAR